MSSTPVIAVDSLRKTYRTGWLGRKGFEALRGISFSVEPGQIFGLLGPNGAGKTTVIKVLLGIVRKSGGTAQLLDRPAGDRHGRQRVGYLPENLRIPRHHTANTALDYYGQLSGLSSSAVRSRRDELLDAVGLAEWGHTRVRKFSKGMLQRLGLAQALLHDPELLILDEPTDGLDPVGRSAVREMLQKLKDQGKTIFLNSHLLQEVELVCDRVAILDRGELRYVGSVDDVTNQPVGDDVELVLVAPESEARAAMDQFSGAVWRADGKNCFRVSVRLPDQAALDDCVDGLRQHGVSIAGLTRRRATLEDAFLQIITASANETSAE